MTSDPAQLCRRLVDDGVVDAVQAAWRRPDGSYGSTAVGCDRESRFALASLTKPIIAVSCLVALEEGAIALEQEVGHGITLEQVLCHAGGLPADDAAARRVQLDPAAGWREVAAAYRAVEPVAPPRTRRIYSNVGYAIAADALERATGMGWGQYATLGVLDPLAMGRTTFGPDLDGPEPVAVREAGLLGHGEPLFNGSRFRALGLPQSGAYGTAEDYLHLLEMVLAGGDGLLAPETAALLRDNRGGVLPGGVGGFMEWERCDWAIGFDVRDGKLPHWTGTALSERAFTHFGASGTLAFADPERGCAGVVLANRGTYSGWMLQAGGWPDLCAAIAA